MTAGERLTDLERDLEAARIHLKSAEACLATALDSEKEERGEWVDQRERAVRRIQRKIIKAKQQLLSG